jgi:GDP-L-fucose synthase
LIKKIVNYKGQIKFNRSYPDGTRKKNLNSSRIKLLGWSPKIKLEDGIRTILNQKKI